MKGLAGEGSEEKGVMVDATRLTALDQPKIHLGTLRGTSGAALRSLLDFNIFATSCRDRGARLSYAQKLVTPDQAAF